MAECIATDYPDLDPEWVHGMFVCDAHDVTGPAASAPRDRFDATGLPRGLAVI